MKFSQLLAKPIRVKGGGIVNLKGLSKHIVDKEIEEGGGGEGGANSLIDKLISLFNLEYPTLSHSSKAAINNGGEYTVNDIDDFTLETFADNGPVYFLYKASEVEQLSNDTQIMSNIELDNGIFISIITKGSANFATEEFDIDGETYVRVYESII